MAEVGARHWRYHRRHRGCSGRASAGGLEGGEWDRARVRLGRRGLERRLPRKFIDGVADLARESGTAAAECEAALQAVVEAGSRAR